MKNKTYVYVLNAELNGPTFGTDDTSEGDYSGITTVHSTLEGALAAFDKWLDSIGIPRELGHQGETRRHSILNDGAVFVGAAMPVVLDGDRINWGINKTEVRA